MPKDKFSAFWLSHSKINDFLTCPRAYYLKNVYKDPNTGHKIQLVTPALALGQVVHEVVESLSKLPTDRRFDEPLRVRLDKIWDKVSGEKGGFVSEEQEREYKQRAYEMLDRVTDNPGPVGRLAIKIEAESDLPYYWFSEEENMILCGKLDWLEYLKDEDAVNIIDFKTGKGQEKEYSLQLPIYHLLAVNCQNRPVKKASYWYLDRDTEPVEVDLPNLEESYERILKIGKKMKLSTQLESFNCPNGEDGCFACKSMEKILRGEAKLIGTGEYDRDIYILNQESQTDELKSQIL